MATKAKKAVPAVIENTTGTAVVNYEAQQRKDLEALSERTAPGGGDKIRITRDKKFKLPDGTTNPGPLSIVVLDFVSGNYFYDKPYKEGEIAPPACFAIGLNPKKLEPSTNSPEKQSDTCGECPNNQFGSKGKGKACANKRKLAVMEPSDDPNAPVYLLDVSATGTGAWDSYVNTLKASLKKMPYGVITDVFFDTNSDFQSLRFGNPQPLPAGVVGNVMSKRAAALDRLLAEPDVSQYVKAAPKKGKK